MSGIFDQIINYSPPLIVSGTVNYKGTWNASTNNPTLNNPPATSTKGDYYVVSTAGTQFTISFAVGDWIISSGTAWEKVDLTDAVSSVFGRTGAVVGASTDYSSVGLTNTAIGASSPSTGAFTTVTASSTIAATGAVTGSNLSGTNTGDQTTITGNAGSATVLQTTRAIYGNNFDGSAALTQVIASTYGGTGNGFAKFSGPASSEKTFTLPNASSTLLYEGGSIGATTANTGAFTTLTTSSTVTHNGGTANGVGYLDASKVLTTGSALTFNGTSLGIGSSDYGNPAAISASIGVAGTTTGGLQLWSSTSGSHYIQFGDGTTSTDPYRGYVGYAHATDSLVLGAASADRLTITSTGINSTAIGATTASTGAFTTLTASTSATVRSGLTGLVIRDYTAGSLVSLYSTNVTASNTNYSLSFDGVDTYLNGATSARLVAAGTTVASATSTGLAVTGALSSTTGANFATSSGNVGIGTTNTPAKFNIQNANVRLEFGEVAGGNYFENQNNARTGTVAFSYYALSHNFYASSDYSQTLTLNSSGNVGIGVTPSAWGADRKVIQLGSGGSINGSASLAPFLELGANFYLDTSDKYLTTAAATKYRQVNGTHNWQIAASGTAGNAITFTQAMTLDASGQLLLGTTSNLATSRRELVMVGTDGALVSLGNSTTADRFQLVSDSGSNALLKNRANTPMVFYTNDTERARIDSSGNLGVGTSSPATRLTVAKSFNISSDGAYAASSASGTGLNFGFDGAGTERSWIQALRNNTSETRELQLNPLGGTVSTGAALTVGGALSKASGSFRIEHPLPAKSATHQLVHSFIEGPQADLIYRGKVVLVDGKASVNIDAASTMTEGTFEVLCRDVQCFTTNETGWTAVRGKVTGNILTIEAKDADCTDEISWMVIGERQDPHMMETDWTDDNGKVIVEPLKPVIETSN